MEQPPNTPESDFSLLFKILTEIFNPKLLTVIGSVFVCIYCIEIKYFPGDIKIGDGLFLVFLILALGLFYGILVFIPSFFGAIFIYLLNFFKKGESFFIAIITLIYCFLYVCCNKYITILLIFFLLLAFIIFFIFPPQLKEYISAQSRLEKGFIAIVIASILTILVSFTSAIIKSFWDSFTWDFFLLLLLLICITSATPYFIHILLKHKSKNSNQQKKNYIKFNLLIISFLYIIIFPQFSKDVFELINVRKTGITAQILDDKEFNRIKNLSESARCTNFILDSDKKLIHNVNILWSGIGANTWVGLPIQGKDNEILFSIESKHISPVINIPPTGISLPENEGSCWDLTEALSPLFQQSIKGNKDEVKQKLIDGNKDTKSIGMKEIFGGKFEQYKGYKYHERSQPQVKLIDKEKKSYRYTHNFEMVNNEENRRNITIQFDFSIKNITITNQATGKQK